MLGLEEGGQRLHVFLIARGFGLAFLRRGFLLAAHAGEICNSNALQGAASAACNLLAVANLLVRHAARGGLALGVLVNAIVQVFLQQHPEKKKN